MKSKSAASKFIDYILLLLISTLAIYLIIATWRNALTGGDYMNAILDFKANYEYIFTLQNPFRVAIFIAPFVLTMILVSIMNQKPKGYSDASSHGAYGSAKFTNLNELRKGGYISESKKSKLSEKEPFVTLNVEEGIILGRVKDELVIVPENSSLNNRNILLVGASGSGKGQTFAINNIINNRTSTIIVTDPKGELYNLTHEIKRDQGYRVYQIDFLNLKGSGFNPLDYVFDDLDAKRVAETIARNASKDDKEDHWFSSAVKLLTGLILYVKDKYESPSISVEVFNEFNKITEDEEYLKDICDEIGEEHVAYQYLKSAAVAKGNERASIFSTFTNKIGIFASDKVKNLTSYSEINFYDLQEELSIVYIKMPIKDNPFLALTATFFDQLINTFYLIGDKYGSVLKIPTIFMLDEFANIGKINGYHNVLSTCRGYRMSMITIVQDFAQLEDMYGKEVSRTIISNHDTILFLKTSDTETAKYLETLAGNTTIRYTTKSKSGGSGWAYYLDLGKSSSSSSNSISEQLVQKPLVSATEFIQIAPNKAYAFISGKVLELEKAYQGVIFKDFVTGSKKIKDDDGITRFPYVYPNNREKYISTFGLKPYEKPLNYLESDLVLKPMEISKNEEKHHIEPLEALQNDKIENDKEGKNDALDYLIDNFIEKIKKEDNKQKIIEKENIEHQDNRTQIIEDKKMKEAIDQEKILNETVEVAKAAFNENPTHEAINELKEITSFKGKIEEISEKIEEISILSEMVQFFESKDNIHVDNVEVQGDEEQGIVEMEEIISEELPM